MLLQVHTILNLFRKFILTITNYYIIRMPYVLPTFIIKLAYNV